MIDLSINKEVLLSVINTRLRNDYPSLAVLCERLDVDRATLEETLAEIDYVYDAKANQFKHRTAL
ncbi:MAG: DUF4250 domain-containing protein [Acholeplasmatales bacterium]|nr:MAG: DUF4250 domain-containing protein [Acholeplasmatales bacterium]